MQPPMAARIQPSGVMLSGDKDASIAAAALDPASFMVTPPSAPLKHPEIRSRIVCESGFHGCQLPSKTEKIPPQFQLLASFQHELPLNMSKSQGQQKPP